jgi:predicted RND superfamily exporter protein
MDKKASDDKDSSVNSYYFMGSLILDVILDIVIVDALLALFSLAFVFMWLRINTGSWFLAYVGLLEIFMSIPVAWFLFGVVCRIKYFAALNSLAIFIVAAIGADDIFIFMDAYKQSKIRHPENLVDMETRMSWVYRRTGSAMAITSATTCAAFLCTLITPLASIQSFGIFAAFVILIDYVLVMTLFCTAVVIYHDRYEDRKNYGCCCPCGVLSPTATEKALKSIEENGENLKGDRISEFFRNKVANFVQVPLHRLVLCVIFLSWLCVAVWQASLIEPTKEAEQFLNEDHPLQKSFTILGKEFPTADEDRGLDVYFAWGLGLVDRTGVNLLLDPDNSGVPTFTESFDFNAQCQTELLNFCDRMKTDLQYKDLIKRKNGLGEVKCFIEELAAYNVKKNLDDCDYVRKGDWKNETWQVDPSNLTDLMDGFLTSTSCFDEEATASISRMYSDEIGWDGSSMKYAAVSAQSNVLSPFGIDAESVTREEYDQFIALAAEADEVVSEYCTGKVVMTDLVGKFVFMNNQSIYVKTAIQGGTLGVVIAFLVLLISTRVLHLAFFASLSIISVLVSVVGVMVMLGWTLGVNESILISIIAGFSVDYVVHLAHAYEIASGDTYERVSEAFSNLGISVFNGMITSVAASIPLFFCQLQFFSKFGTFLCLTIAFSWVFANFGFMSLLAQLKVPIKEGKGCHV